MWNLIFGLELLIDLIVGDSFIKSYSNNFRMWPETICQILNVFATAMFLGFFFDQSQSNFKLLKYVKFYEAILFIRMTKLVPLLNEVPVMRLIIETLRNLTVPLKNLCIVVIAIFYTFSIIGMFIFGGKIQTTTYTIVYDASIPIDFVLMNFNDLISSFVTLFALVVVNNWYVIVNVNVAAVDGNELYRLYFLAFYYFGVLIGINILISFAIDTYGAVLRLEENKIANERYLVALAGRKERIKAKRASIIETRVSLVKSAIRTSVLKALDAARE